MLLKDNTQRFKMSATETVRAHTPASFWREKRDSRRCTASFGEKGALTKTSYKNVNSFIILRSRKGQLPSIKKGANFVSHKRSKSDMKLFRVNISLN